MKLVTVFQFCVLAHTGFAAEAVCRWKDDTIAKEYLPCIQGATRGTCCRQGETCLESGLCYGGIGLVYRGACVNVWDQNSCLTYCEDISKDWANLYPCPVEGLGSGAGPLTWWCGNSGQKACTSQGVTLKIAPGLGARVLPLIEDLETSTSTSSNTGPPTGSPTSSETQSAASRTPYPSSSNFQPVLIGLGVGLGALALAIFAGVIFWIRYHRRQRANHLDQSYGPAPLPGSGIYDPKNELDSKSLSRIYPPVEMSNQRRVVELGGNKKAVELDSSSYI